MSTSSLVTEEKRDLGPDMTAEGWIVIGGDNLLWLHPPTQRAVAIESIRWNQCRRIPCWGSEPKDPNADGYLVVCRVHDNLGNPMFGDSVWVESYATAIKLARKIRTDILAETPAQTRRRKAEHARRGGEAWAEIAEMCRNNARILAEKGSP